MEKPVRVLFALDDKLKSLSSLARDAFLSKDHHAAAIITASAREHAAQVHTKTVHQLSDGSLVLVPTDAHPSDIASQVSEDASAALLGNQAVAD